MSTLIFLSIAGGSGTSIPAVANYAALELAYPPPNTAYLGQYVFCENSQGTAWLPGPLLGTYYPAGLYYCNGVDWKYANVPYQATQIEVDAGVVEDKFLSPKTFNNSAQLLAKANLSGAIFTGNISASNLSNTNTGDETQSSILSKLGWFKTTVTTNYTVTGTSGETIILPSTQLPTLSNGSIFKINTLRISKGAVSGSTIRAYLSPNSNNLSGAVQILSTGSTIVTGTRLATISRVFEIEGGNIKGLNAATGVINDNGTSTVVGLDAALPSGTLYLIVTFTNSAAGESTTQELLDISNF